MKVVLALDSTAASWGAVNFLANLPLPGETEVTIVTALVNTDSDAAKSSAGDAQRVMESELAETNFERASALLSRVCPRCEHVQKREQPRRLIMQVAAEVRADLIVLGTHCHSAAHRVFIGSTAGYVAGHAKCSTLVVQTPDSENLAEPESDREQERGRALRVLAAYDGSPSAAIALTQLNGLSWPEETQIHFAWMHERPKLLPPDVIYDPELVAASEQDLERLRHDSELACQVNHTVGETLHIGSALAKIARRESVDLLFVGCANKSTVKRWFLAGTARYLLHHVAASVWIARENHWVKQAG